MFKLLSFISISFIFLSCNNQSQDKTNSIMDSTTTVPQNSIDSIPYTYKTIKDNSQYFVEYDNNIDTTYFQVTYPYFQDKILNDSIKNIILIDGESEFAEASQSFIDGFDEYIGDSDGGVQSSWSKDISTKVIVNTEKILTLLTNSYEYSGGIHGIHHAFFTILDPKSKRRIFWEDILQKNKFQQLTKIAEKRFRALNNLNETEPLNKEFFFQDGIFSLNDNFGLAKKSLIIYYNVYEIKPYSEGPTILEIPYEELNDVLNIQAKQYIKSIL